MTLHPRDGISDGIVQFDIEIPSIYLNECRYGHKCAFPQTDRKCQTEDQ